MNSKQKATLEAVFTDPVSGTITWASIESLLVAAGARTIEGAGSAVRFECKGLIARFHRPHPTKEAKRYQVRDAREFLIKIKIPAMNAMTYKGYAARIEYDDDDGIFFGHLAGINDGVGFHADTVAELRAAFRAAVDDYVETCAKIGKKPEKPYSGQLMVRVDPEVHARAALAAELSGKSLAKWTEERLREGADHCLPA